MTGTGKDKVSFDRVADRAAPTAYAAEEADVDAPRSGRVLKPRLAAERLTRVYERLERPMVPVLGRMERRGIKVDRQILSRLSGTFAQKAGAVEAEIYEIAGQEFNIGSTKQLGDILFGKLGVPGGKKTRTGQWSTDVKVLEDLAEEGVPIARKIVEWRQLTKLKSTYTDALPRLHPPADRPRPHELSRSPPPRPAASPPPSRTSRTSRSAPRRAAPSAAPSSPRTVCKLLSADYSQIELRVLAHIAEIPQLRKAFADGLDIHAMTASEMFGVPIEGMDPDVRRRAKAINFGIIYGISAFGLAAQLAIPRGEAADYINRYFERFPGIRDYMECDQALCPRAPLRRDALRPARALSRKSAPRSPRLPRLPGARRDQRADPGLGRRHHPPRHDPHGRRAGGGRPSRAGCCCRCMTNWSSRCPTTEVEATIPVIRRVMEAAAEPAVKLRVPLQVDARAADNWDEAH